MNPVVAKQVALDNSLVPSEKRLKIEKCNARIEFSKPQREKTYQVTLDALKLSPCYPALLITTEVPEVYMHQFWNTIQKIKDTNACRCISRKTTGLDRLRESRAQILWGMYNKKNVDYVALLWEEFMYQADNRKISSARKEHMPYPKFTKVIISHFIFKDKTISMRNKINLHIIHDDTLLDVKDSKAYKTYYDFATGKATPKKARKFKKVASPSRKLSHILEKEPTENPKELRNLPRSLLLCQQHVLQSETLLVSLCPAQLKKTLKKSKLETHKLYASGSGDGVGSQPKVPDEQEDKTTVTDEGTGTKPGVPDVPKYLSESENESWGDSGDDDDNDEVTKDDDEDDVESDADDDKEASDSEKTDSNEDENLNLNQNDDEKEEKEEEYVRTPDSFEFNDDDEEYEELYKDVNVRLTDIEHEEQRKEDEEMTDAGRDDSTQQTKYEHVKDDEHVRHEEPSTQTPPLFNIPVTVIPETSTAAESAIPPTIPPITPLQQQSTPTSTPAPTTATTTTSVPALLDFSSLFGFDQREVFDYATPVIQKSITGSLKNIVLAKSSSQPKSTYEEAASLTEFELKKILLDKIQKSKSYQGAQEHKDLYDALVKSYKLDKDLFESYDQWLKKQKTSKDAKPSRGSKSKESKSSLSKGSKSQSKSSSKSAQAEEPVFETADTEMPLNQGEDLGNTDDQPNVEATSKDDWFKKPKRPPTPDLDWNTTKSIDFRPPQTWISKINKVGKPPLTFNELMSTLIDFSAYLSSRVELEYHFKECYKAVTDRLDWTNPEGHEYPFDLSKPLLLIEDQGRQVAPANYFINNDLEYLKGGSLSRKYTTSTTKTRATKYDTIEGIEDMVLLLWSLVKHDVFSTKRIIAVTHVKVMKKYDYGYLEEIVVRREDQQLYKLIEGDFPRLNLHDIEDMLLLLVQKKLSNLERDDLFDLNVALRMFTRRVVILKRVEDLQLGVEIYPKKLNITRPETFRSDISSMTPYTAYNNPQGIIYLDKFQRNRLMRFDELYKFCDDTLSSIRRVLHDIASSLEMDYLPKRR
ncbi:hypothetical protein Tco_0908620 [Tanacetum coccineum]|uniref:Reverse transcriptase domain-containing protein n=1 Tax=Tanacetum coccineum TaxID=301880 RepID=A0ABQ5CNT6_9ASTR